MSTDLTKVQDHPATLIEAASKVHGDHLSAKFTEGFHAAGNYLRGVETGRGVTFAALDNDALEAVREAYKVSVEAKRVGYTHLALQADADLRSAIGDLLGLND